MAFLSKMLFFLFLFLFFVRILVAVAFTQVSLCFGNFKVPDEYRFQVYTPQRSLVQQ